MPSMSDLFHEGIQKEWIDRIVASIALVPHLKVTVLTKRPERIQKYFAAAKQRIRRLAVDLGRERNLDVEALETCQ
jgi:protein gp37